MITDAELGLALTQYADALSATIVATQPDATSAAFRRPDRPLTGRDRSPRAPWMRGNGSRLALAAAIVVFALIAAAIVVIGRHDSPPAGAPGWTKLPAAPLGHRVVPVVVWSGKEWLVFGGENNTVDPGPAEIIAYAPGYTAPPTTAAPPDSDPYPEDGAAYDPEAKTWTRIPTLDLGGREPRTVAGPASLLTVLGSDLSACAPRTESIPREPGPGGATYDPNTKKWLSLPAMPDDLSCEPDGTWLGSVLYVTAITADLHNTTFGSYDPATRRWTERAAPPAAPPVGGGTLVASGGRLYDFVPAEAASTEPNGPAASPARVASFDPHTGRWAVVATPPIDAEQLVDVAGRPVAWDGSRGAVLDVTTGTWQALAAMPLDRRATTVVAVGSRMVVWGGSQAGDQSDPTTPVPSFDDGAAYDFATGAWSVLPLSPISGRFAEGVAGSSDSMFVWGGSNTSRFGQPLDDGAILEFG